MLSETKSETLRDSTLATHDSGTPLCSMRSFGALHKLVVQLKIKYVLICKKFYLLACCRNEPHKVVHLVLVILFVILWLALNVHITSVEISCRPIFNLIN